MLLPLVAFLLAAEPAPAKAQVHLALPGLNAVNLSPGEGELYAELVSQKFEAHDVRVMTSRDLASMLGVERQRQLLGCSENSCVVEMTAALGVDGVLVGDLGKLGEEYALNLKVLSSKDARPLALYNGRAPSSKGLPAVIENGVRSLLRDLSKSLGRPELEKDTDPVPELNIYGNPQPSGLRTALWGVTGAGVIGLGVGIGLQLVAGGNFAELQRGGLTEERARALRDGGRGMETGGTIALIAGGVLAAAGATLLVLGVGEEAPTASVLVTPHGGAFVLGGSF